MKRAIARYNQKEKVSLGSGDTLIIRRATSFAIEIEFDHCVVSLRSCIEHLLQLINHVASLGFVPTSHSRSEKVDFDNVIQALRRHNNMILNRLGDHLGEEKRKDWYRTLHKLRIEMYHNKFERFQDHGGHIKVELPTGQEVNLITYCNTAINDLERILTYSVQSLTRYLNLIP